MAKNFFSSVFFYGLIAFALVTVALIVVFLAQSILFSFGGFMINPWLSKNIGFLILGSAGMTMICFWGGWKIEEGSYTDSCGYQ